MADLLKLRSKFKDKYGSSPRIFRAPGRVNLIGEHTDYNDGYVLPCAIDFATYVAASARSDRTIHAASLNFELELDLDLEKRAVRTDKSWTKYVEGVSKVLERSGHRLSGADLLIDSDVPLGAGLSSSAALEISTAFALATLSGHTLDGIELAKIGQTAEHEFAGVRSGIMDQFASVFGQERKALFLDCRSLEWKSISTSDAQFIICNTKTSHDLADGEYNRRRSECEAAAEFCGKASLRDVPADEFEQRSHEMPEILKKRARHILTENERVLRAVDALAESDLDTFSRLLNESHESLRDDFEVSSKELDLMVDLARQNGALGARMTGGGFGGCTINLLEAKDPFDFIETMTRDYRDNTGIMPEIYPCKASGGVCELENL